MTGPAPTEPEKRQALLESGRVVAMAIGDPENKAELLRQLKDVIEEIDDIEFPGLIGNTGERKCSMKSICFSTLIEVPVLLTVKTTTEMNPTQKISAVTTVGLVDYQNVGEITLKRPFLTEQVNKIGFDKGILTSMAFKQPSEGLAVATLPLDILDAIMRVPANFFKTALSGPFSGQKEILQQQKELTKIQKETREDLPQKDSIITETAESFKLECRPLLGKPE
jgi:hypothetical protein